MDLNNYEIPKSIEAFQAEGTTLTYMVRAVVWLYNEANNYPWIPYYRLRASGGMTEVIVEKWIVDTTLPYGDDRPKLVAGTILTIRRGTGGDFETMSVENVA
jgi:hypothetical protein